MPYKKIAISDLQQIVNLAHQTESREQKIAALMQAFEKFSLESIKVEEAYSVLEAKLTATQHYLEDILKNMSQGLLFIMPNGVIKTCNPAAERLLGLPVSQIVSHDFDQRIGLPLLGFSFFEKVKNKGNTIPFSVVIGAKEPIEVEVETTIASEGMIVLLRDITQLKRLERIAERNDRMKELGQMAAVMAHEIRNPLGGVKGFASLLQRDLEGQPELQKMAEHIVQGAEETLKQPCSHK